MVFYKKDPDNVIVMSRKANTGVDNDVTMLFEFEHALATLNSSFRCKLNNWTYIVGDKGYIAIPDFWRARERFLYNAEACVEHFKDPRRGFGFDFEIYIVNSDLLEGKTESDIMPQDYRMKFQEHMHRVASNF